MQEAKAKFKFCSKTPAPNGEASLRSDFNVEFAVNGNVAGG